MKKRWSHFVLDLDGTFYNLSDVWEMSYNMQVDFLSLKRNLSKEEAIRFLEENQIFKQKTEESKSATELFASLGISLSEWSTFREERFDVEQINKYNAIREYDLRKISLGSKIVLLSSNSLTIIYRILHHIGIRASFFEDIICSNHSYGGSPFSKKKEMTLMPIRYGIPIGQIVSIGDRLKTDITPMVEIGGNGILVEGPAGFRCFLEDYSFPGLKKERNYHIY